MTYDRRWFSYYALKTGVEVHWRAHPISFLYHATYDGQSALCGVAGLVEGEIPSFTHDPSNDTMTCMNCQGLVRRVKTNATREQESADRAWRLWCAGTRGKD